MNVSFLSLLLLYIAVLQLAEVVVTAEQKDKYQLFRRSGKRIRPVLGRRKNGNEAEVRFVSTAFLHKLVDLKGTTTTTTVKPTGTSPTSSTITGPTTITPFSPPLSAPFTVATYTRSSSRALDSVAVAAGGGKHIRKSEEDEDDDFIPYTAGNFADFPAYGKAQRTQRRRGRNKLVKRQKRLRQQTLVKPKVQDHEL